MGIKVLRKDACSIKENLAGKKRIMIYGAGTWANDIHKMLRGYGYGLDCAIVDEQYYNGKAYVERQGGVKVVTVENIKSSYDPQHDAVIWAIASPEKLRTCMKDGQMEYLLLYDMGFWKDKNYSTDHQKEFQETAKLLCDEYSKKVFWAYLDAQKGNIDNDILYSTDGTYFNELTKEKRSGSFLDCGSYDGETAVNYMKFTGEECLVYAFEPDKENYQKLVERMKNRQNFICLNKGCYSCEQILSFSANGDMSSSLQENGNETVSVTTIDKVVGDEKVAFIKMDIEGAELEALKGAKKIIERDMPVLAISAYHRQEDLITLIPYINDMHSEHENYKIFLRHHGVVQTELVIYAIPKGNSAI